MELFMLAVSSVLRSWRHGVLVAETEEQAGTLSSRGTCRCAGCLLRAWQTYASNQPQLCRVGHDR